MNWDQIKGDWHQLSRKLKEKWKMLTDADLKTIAGRRDQLEEVLQRPLRLRKRSGGDRTRQVYRWTDVVALSDPELRISNHWRRPCTTPKMTI